MYVKSTNRGEIKEFLLEKWPLCSWVNVQYSFAVISISSKLSNTSVSVPIISVSSSTPRLIRVISLVWTFEKAKLLSEINNSHRLIKGNYIRRSYVFLYPES